MYPLIDPAPAFAAQSYKDQVIVVTGGSAGIGFATALMYARAGAKVVINGRNAPRLDAKKAEIEKDVEGAEVLTVAGDVSKVDIGKKIVSETVNKWGKIDVVIANSGLLMGGRRKFSLLCTGKRRSVLVAQDSMRLTW